MARFIIAHRLAGQSTASSDRARDAFHQTVTKMRAFASIASAPKPGAKSARSLAIVDTDAREMKAKMQSLSPDVMVEPEMVRIPARLFPLSRAIATSNLMPMPAGTGASFKLNVSCNGSALNAAKVALTLTNIRTFATSSVLADTDEAGNATLPYDGTFWVPSSVIVMPWSGAWSWVVAVSGPEMTLSLPSLPQNGPLGWWHYALNVFSFSQDSGKGIRVGVADTGIAAHVCLKHVQDIGAFVNGQHHASAASGADIGDHGTHVAGIIGARPPDKNGEFGGIAPGVDLFSARVYPSVAEGGGGPQSESASNGDVAIAIDALVNEHKVDLINLSLGGLQSSQVELDAIQAAVQAGTLVICSAGNENGGPVTFPAAYAQSIGVSAIGVPGCSPSGGLDASTMPTQMDRFSYTGLYSPTFTSVGPAINCVGPGVGIISTVPGKKSGEVAYAGMSGTSMAAPAVCAALATVLSKDQVYQSTPRGPERAVRAATLLAQSFRDLGLSPQYQGSGLPGINW